MTHAPETLTLSRHRDREGWLGPWPSGNEIEKLEEIKFAVVEPGGKMSFLKN
jgi:hypothetical protein